MFVRLMKQHTNSPKDVHSQPGVLGVMSRGQGVVHKGRWVRVGDDPGSWETEDLSGRQLPKGPRATPGCQRGDRTDPRRPGKNPACPCSLRPPPAPPHPRNAQKQEICSSTRYLSVLSPYSQPFLVNGKGKVAFPLTLDPVSDPHGYGEGPSS